MWFHVWAEKQNFAIIVTIGCCSNEPRSAGTEESCEMQHMKKDIMESINGNDSDQPEHLTSPVWLRLGAVNNLYFPSYFWVLPSWYDKLCRFWSHCMMLFLIRVFAVHICYNMPFSWHSHDIIMEYTTLIKFIPPVGAYCNHPKQWDTFLITVIAQKIEKVSLLYRMHQNLPAD